MMQNKQTNKGVVIYIVMSQEAAMQPASKSEAVHANYANPIAYVGRILVIDCLPVALQHSHQEQCFLPARLV